jgi:NTP pyrophosphatase (non-canonical NTP hydrolase)
MTEPNFNNLSPAETERLAILSEEMGEAIQVIGKILRHGYDSYHPLNDRQTNKDLLSKEIGDVLASVHIMYNAGDIDDETCRNFGMHKLQTIQQWTHHQTKHLFE